MRAVWALTELGGNEEGARNPSALHEAEDPEGQLVIFCGQRTKKPSVQTMS